MPTALINWSKSSVVSSTVMGRPSLAPGCYFRLLLLGYFEGIDSERGIAWRVSDSLAVRSFLWLSLEIPPPDHSTISRTRRSIDLDTHRAVFTWVLAWLAETGLLKGKTVAINATTLEANAAVRRDIGASYDDFLTGLAQASGIETPTREELARLDRKRKKKTSNKDWTNPHDPDAKVIKMKDRRTHLAHKAEHAVDLETGAVVAVTLQGADHGDTTTIDQTLSEAVEHLATVADATDVDVETAQEVVTDKGYHSRGTVLALQTHGFRTYNQRTGPRAAVLDGSTGCPRGGVCEPSASARNPEPASAAPARRVCRRSFAHVYDTGGLRRMHLRGHANILKRLSFMWAASILGW